MGKGNKHRGHRDDQQHDRGEEKAVAQRSFGGGGQRFSGTIGGSLGQTERHSEEHFKMITAMQDIRKKSEAKEKELTDKVPDYPLYILAKRQMLDLEKKLKLLPEFTDYQKMRMDLRAASAKFDEAKARCTKCNFVRGAVSSTATATPTPAHGQSSQTQPPASGSLSTTLPPTA